MLQGGGPLLSPAPAEGQGGGNRPEGAAHFSPEQRWAERGARLDWADRGCGARQAGPSPSPPPKSAGVSQLPRRGSSSAAAAQVCRQGVRGTVGSPRVPGLDPALRLPPVSSALPPSADCPRRC